jgi:molybdopterin converting factor small subunit
VCLFNSLRKYSADGMVFRTHLPDGATVADLLRRLALPRKEIYVAFRNGASITHDLGRRIDEDTVLADGDRVAFSGPVPFSRGYGAPVI